MAIEEKAMQENPQRDLFEGAEEDDLFGRPTIGDLFPDFNPPTETKEKEKSNEEETDNKA